MLPCCCSGLPVRNLGHSTWKEVTVGGGKRLPCGTMGGLQCGTMGGQSALRQGIEGSSDREARRRDHGRILLPPLNLHLLFFCQLTPLFRQLTPVSAALQSPGPGEDPEPPHAAVALSG